jgi:hypothetical protein
MQGYVGETATSFLIHYAQDIFPFHTLESINLHYGCLSSGVNLVYTSRTQAECSYDDNTTVPELRLRTEVSVHSFTLSYVMMFFARIAIFEMTPRAVWKSGYWILSEDETCYSNFFRTLPLFLSLSVSPTFIYFSSTHTKLPTDRVLKVAIKCKLAAGSYFFSYSHNIISQVS